MSAVTWRCLLLAAAACLWSPVSAHSLVRDARSINLLQQQEPESPSSRHQIEISTRTCDEPGAESDGNIYLNLEFSVSEPADEQVIASTRIVYLDDPDRDDFQRGRTDKFVFAGEVPEEFCAAAYPRYVKFWMSFFFTDDDVGANWKPCSMEVRISECGDSDIYWTHTWDSGELFEGYDHQDEAWMDTITN